MSSESNNKKRADIDARGTGQRLQQTPGSIKPRSNKSIEPAPYAIPSRGIIKPSPAYTSTNISQTKQTSSPFNQAGLRKPPPRTTAVRIYPQSVTTQMRMPFPVFTHPRGTMRRPFSPATTVNRPPQRIHQLPGMHASGQMRRRLRRNHPSFQVRPTIVTPSPYRRTMVAAPAIQAGIGRPVYYPYCPPHQTIAPAAASTIQAPYKAVPARKPICHTCGSRYSGCMTLSRFAFNSAQLKPMHKKLLRELATRILRGKINAIIATGHTDRRGAESYNEALGARRAGAVIRELRKQLSILRPSAHKNLFWKIETRGKRYPISTVDAAANRRVHICVRKLKS